MGVGAHAGTKGVYVEADWAEVHAQADSKGQA